MSDEKITAEFERIYNETYPIVMKYISSKVKHIEDISDIAQDVYQDFYIHLSKGIPTLIGEKGFLKWLSKCKIANYYKRQAVLPDSLSVIADDDGETLDIYDIADLDLSISIEQNNLNKELLSEIWQFLKSKDEMTKRIFFLYYYIEMPLKEIAETLKIKEQTVKNKLFRVTKQIRHIFHQSENYIV
ncbi:MAG: sigma-70 family RNA polymerase sigma factor [Clostridia bacterium]